MSVRQKHSEISGRLVAFGSSINSSLSSNGSCVIVFIVVVVMVAMVSGGKCINTSGGSEGDRSDGGGDSYSGSGSCSNSGYCGGGRGGEGIDDYCS